MVALEIRFLTQRYAATQYNDWNQPEWPPHPARVYSALVAALHDDPDAGSDELSAVEWLAAAGPPDVLASEAGVRHQRSVYVPGNQSTVLGTLDDDLVALDSAIRDLAAATSASRAAATEAVLAAEARVTSQSAKSLVGKGGIAAAAPGLLPNGRGKQPRTFPVALPNDDVVHLIWRCEVPPGVGPALDRVSARVARLGHSSSLVSMRFIDGEVDEAGRQRWIPSAAGDQLLRVPQPGQLARLEEAHARHQQVEPRVLPSESIVYARSGHMKRESGRSAGTVFADDGWLVFELVPPPSGGSRTLLDVSMAQQVARAMRGTLLAAIDGGWPEVLSGHAPDGRPSDRPHLAVLPLADLGHPYATGTILGVALVPPVDLDEASRRALMTAVAKAEQRVQADDVDRRDDEPPALRLTLGRAGTMDLRRARDVSMKKTLRLETWTRPSARWATVTAVALGRNPGNLRSREPEVIERAVAAAEATIAASCLHIGLPQPAAVWVHKRSLLEGAPEARRFTPFPSAGDGPRRVCVHAEIVFDEPVRGPVLLGAGRYLGLGICRPLGDG